MTKQGKKTRSTACTQDRGESFEHTHTHIYALSRWHSQLENDIEINISDKGGGYSLSPLLS